MYPTQRYDVKGQTFQQASLRVNRNETDESSIVSPSNNSTGPTILRRFTKVLSLFLSRDSMNKLVFLRVILACWGLRSCAPLKSFRLKWHSEAFPTTVSSE